MLSRRADPHCALIDARKCNTAETPIILPTTLDFLARLVKNNEREWFKARGACSPSTHIEAHPLIPPEACLQMPSTGQSTTSAGPERKEDGTDSSEFATRRHALLNFNTFIKAWIPLASEADWQLPHLPAKDVVHWIYRDVRCEFLMRGLDKTS